MFTQVGILNFICYLLRCGKQYEHTDERIADRLKVTVVHVLREQVKTEQRICSNEKH